MMKVVSLFSLLLFSSLAVAQIPSGNVFIGYSYTRTNLVPDQTTGLNGWNGSVEGKVLPLLGLVADFSGHYGSQGLPQVCPLQVVPCIVSEAKVDVSEYNFLFGPRLSFRVGKFRPFVHALIGASHLRENASPVANSDTSFADALGGGLDYRLIPLISLRFQADALQTRFFSGSQSNIRFSTGIVVNF